MERLEYLKSQSTKMRDDLDDVRKRLNRMLDVPKGPTLAELRRQSLRLTGGPRETHNVIFDGLAEMRRILNALDAEVQTVDAALDDAIGPTGRLF